jgi:hypothetical protein
MFSTLKSTGLILTLLVEGYSLRTMIAWRSSDTQAGSPERRAAIISVRILSVIPHPRRL